MIIKKLHIAIFKEFIPLFIAVTIITLFVFVLQTIWLYADDLIGKELKFTVFLELFYYIMLMNIIIAMPISIMLASIITFGNMGERFELTAAKSAGISLYRIMQPLIKFAIISTFFIFFAAENLVPYATYQALTLITSIRQQHPTMRFQEGIFNYDIQDYVIKIGKKNKNTNILYDILIYDHKNYDGNRFVVAADSGKIIVTEDLSYLLIELYNGTQYEEITENTQSPHLSYPYHIDYFKKQRILIPLTNFQFKKADISYVKQQHNMLTTKQLLRRIDSLKISYENKKNYWVKVWTNNDLFRSAYRPKTQTDSAQYENKIRIYNNLEPEKMRTIIDIDSAIKSQPINSQKNIVQTARILAENLNNRSQVYSYEGIARRETIAMHQISLHRKFVFSIACLIFLFIGAPLGSIIRKGGFGLPVIISVIFVLLFYIAITLGERLARSGTMSAANSTWLVIYIYAPIAVYIYYKASKDSVIMHPEIVWANIKNFFIKFFGKFSKKQQK